MNKYQISLVSASDNNAGGKAPSDVFEIAKKLDYKPEKVILKSDLGKFGRQLSSLIQWKQIFKDVKRDSIILIQAPIYSHYLGRSYYLRKLKRQKNIKYIFLVHDVEELRQIYNDSYQQKQLNEILDLVNIIIVHNKKMKSFFERKGVSSEKIINLEIFDYLTASDATKKSIDYSQEIIIAGNLDVKKTRYLRDLNIIPVSFSLYGPNFSLSSYPNVHYNGSVAPDDLPKLFQKGFGLIWDGDSVDNCQGPFGNYLRYNNPHKLSLYLNAGIPVIIWKYAAEANFVEKYKVGFTVESLHELPKLLESISSEEYAQVVKNTKKLSYKLSRGFFTTRALREAEERINGDRSNER